MPEFDNIIDQIEKQIQEIDQTKDSVFPFLREGIKAAGRAIEAMHNHQDAKILSQIKATENALKEVKTRLSPFPRLAYSNMSLTLEQEYSEAIILRAILSQQSWPTPRSCPHQISLRLHEALSIFP